MNQVNKQQLMDMLVNEINRHAQQNQIRYNLAQQCNMNGQHISILTEVAYWILTAAINTPGCTDTTQTILGGIQNLVRYYAGFLSANNPQIMNDPALQQLRMAIQNDANAWAAAAREAEMLMQQLQQQQMQPQLVTTQPMGLVTQAPVMPMAGMVQMQQFPQITSVAPAPRQTTVTSNRNITFGAPNARPEIGGDPHAATRKTIGGKANPKIRRPGQPFGQTQQRTEPVVEIVQPTTAPAVVAKNEEKLSVRDWRPNLENNVCYLRTFDQRFGYERFHYDNKNRVFQEVILKGKNMSDQDYERHKTAFLGTRYAIKSANPDTYRKMAKTISQVRKAVDETVRQQKQFVPEDSNVVDLTDEKLVVQVSTELTHVTSLSDAFVVSRGEHIRRQAMNDTPVLVMAKTVIQESHFELDMVSELQRDADYELLANLYTCNSVMELVGRLEQLSDEFKAIHMPVLERMFLDEINHQLWVGFSLRGVTMTNLFEDAPILDEAIRKYGGVAMLQKWKDFEQVMFQLIFCPPAVISKKPLLAEQETGGEFDPETHDLPGRGNSTIGRICRLATITRIAVHRNDLNLMIDENPRIGRLVDNETAPFILELIGNVQNNAMWARKHFNHYLLTLDGYVVRLTMAQLGSGWLISESQEQLRA